MSKAVKRHVLSPEEWAEVRRLFDECVELPPAEREGKVNAAAAGREWLREEVLSLLAESDGTDDLLASPVLGALASHGGAVRAPAASTAVGERFGDYLLVHRLGFGGMAEVFLAKKLGPHGYGRLVAVKRILPQFSNDPEFRQLFESEAKLGSRLSHANIAHLYDFGDQDGAYFLAMELVNGVNLSLLLRRARETKTAFPIDVGLYIAARVADGLGYAHRLRDQVTGQKLGIIHRDVSPKNIMVSFEGGVKIVDFGIAKAMGTYSGGYTRALKGTVGYFPPEAVTGTGIDERSDLFSTCVILYELLAGQPLFETGDLLSSLGQIQSWDVSSERLRALSVDEDLRAILTRGLARAPEERYASAAELTEALQAYLQKRGATGLEDRTSELVRSLCADELQERRGLIELASAAVSPSGTSTPAARVSLRPVTWWWPVVAAALTIAVITAIGLSVRSRPSPQLITAAGPCASDAARLCPGMRFRSGLGRCLLQRRDEIDPRCRRFLEALPGMDRPFRE